MTTIVIIITAAAVGFGLATWWRLPYAPLLLLIGVVLSASGLIPEGADLQDILLLGVTFLVFFVGTELNLQRVGNQKLAALIVALARFVLLGGLGFVVAIVLNFSVHASLYLALAVTASSTLMVVSLLRQRRQFFEPFGRLVIGVLLVEDLLIIMLLPLLTRAPDGVASMVQGGLAALGLVVLALVCLRWISPWLLVRIRLDDESELLTILAILFAFVGAAFLLELPLVTGAFLAGVALSGFPVAGMVRSQVSSLSNFFLCLFFIAMGAAVSFPEPRQLILDVAIIGAILLLAPMLIALLARRTGLNLRSSIESSWLLAQCGEFSIVVVLVGLAYGHLGNEALTAIVVVAALTMMITPFTASDALTWQLMRWLGRDGRVQTPIAASNHVLLLGCGRHMWPVMEYLEKEHQQVVVIDDDPGVLEALRGHAVTAIRGDGADFRVLRLAGARDASVVISSMRRQRDHIRLLRFMRRERPVLVRTFDPEHGRELEAMGAIPIVEGEAVIDDVMRWIDHWHETRRAAASQSISET